MHIYWNSNSITDYITLLSRGCDHILLHGGNRLLAVCVTISLLKRRVLARANKYLHAPVLTVGLVQWMSELDRAQMRTSEPHIK
jgi:hypothetical protein